MLLRSNHLLKHAKTEKETGVSFIDTGFDYLYQQYLPDSSCKIWYDFYCKSRPPDKNSFHNRMPGASTLCDKVKFSKLIQTQGIPPSVAWNGDKTRCPPDFSFPCLAKPRGGHQGRGIMWIGDPNDLDLVPGNERFVLSSYVQDLLLFEHRKMHLRLFVLVKPFDGKVWLHREGICLCARNVYDDSNLDFRGTHLTNGCPIPIKSHVPLQDKEYLVLSRLSLVLNRVFRAWFAQHTVTDEKAFAIFGIDVLVDEDFEPYLLEFNPSWSTEIHNQVELEVKCQNMIPDFFKMVRDPSSSADSNCILVFDKK